MLSSVSEPSEEIRSGRVLHGNDFTGRELEAWFEAEREGYFELTKGDDGPRTLDTFCYRAQNRIEGAPLRGRRYEKVLALGPAEGFDLLALELDIGRIVAIEPGRGFWSDSIGGIATEWREPSPDGTIDLPDGAMDLVVAMSVLHHIPNVERVVAELGRVLKPGGRFIIREPTSSMGDWTKPRPGLTKYERGIPPTLMERFIAGAGLQLRDKSLAQFGIMRLLWRQLGFCPYTRAWAVHLDHWLSAAWPGRYIYWRTSPWHALAPGVATYVGIK